MLTSTLGRVLRLGLLLLAWLGLVFASAAQAAAEPAPQEQRLRVALQLEPPILDPTAGAAAPISELVYGNVFEGLLTLGADGEPQPRLALRWDIAPDGLSYEFALRPGVRFHDGTPFDAAVAKFSLDRARAQGSINPQRSSLQAIHAVEVLGPLRLRIQLLRRQGGLLQALGAGALVMVAPATAATNSSHPVGTGPYRFEAWRRGEAVELRRFDGYWGGRPAIAQASYRFIADPSAAFAALMAGDVDLFSNFPAPENIAQFQADPRFAVEIASSEGETILSLNHRHPALAQLAVRRAIAHAIDRRALIEGAMFGFGQPIGSHFPPSNAAYVDLTGVYRYDPQRARSLLAQVGLAQGLSLRMKLPPTPYARRSGEIIAAQLAQVGIQVRIENLEWAQWLDQVYKRHDFELSVVAHVEPLDYTIYGREGYYFGYQSAAFKALLARLDEQTEPAARHELLQEIQRKLSEDAVNGFLFQYPRLLVRNAQLRLGGPPNALGVVQLGAASYAPGALGSFNLPAQGSRAWGWGAWLTLAVLGLAATGLAALMALALRRSGPRWLAQRLLGLGLTLVLASGLVFVLVQLAPGDPARYMMGLNADAEVLAALRQQLGLDAPALQRYGQWIWGFVQGDFGRSYTYRVPVSQLLQERLQVSLPLAVLALSLAVLLALPVGLIAAHRRGSWVDGFLSSLTQLGVAVPNFWLGLLLVLVFAVGLRWLPAGGFEGWEAGPGAALRSLLLPALALALPQAAILARVLRGALIACLHEDYLRSARAKGLSAWQALLRHALPNALVPVLTILGMQFSFLLAGAVIIENVFFLPGLGRLLFQAVAQRDLILLQSLVLLLAVAVAAVSFVVEMAYRVADPRIGNRVAQA
ncbi:ABC transporter substrate-binding protein [Paucibacter sp. KBW04]|uniref:ABC transporter substrate-binding protein n=1 Tax=Paucibacter sp. KBW04 TaxID=2153361 RepID=UPI0018CC5565